VKGLATEEFDLLAGAEGEHGCTCSEESVLEDGSDGLATAEALVSRGLARWMTCPVSPYGFSVDHFRLTDTGLLALRIHRFLAVSPVAA
jgi:hypothetical protein